MLMNPQTHLIPILGVYSLTVTRNGNSLPVFFLIQRHIRSFDLKALENDDLVFNFDIKGNLHGVRKTLENPREIMKLDVSILKQQMYKDATLKDQDFLQSFKKLDITQVQAEKIISQLEQDVEVLAKSGFIDYSLLMIVVLRPFKNIETVNTNNLGLSAFDQILNKGEDGQQNSNSKRLFISEVDPRSLIRPDPYQQMMVVVEQTRTRIKVFHICDAYDISSIKA